MKSIDEIQMTEPKVCFVQQRPGIVCRLVYRVVCGSALRSLQVFVLICLCKIRKARHNKKGNTLCVCNPSDFVVSLSVAFVVGDRNETL
jgi:hypothetical protein